MKRRLLSLLLALVMLVTALLPVLPAAEAAKATKTRAIAIVFDNSSSMYICGGSYPNPNVRWNRATYAMEVFASMLNEGDTLYVFPMNPIEVDGTKYQDDNPLVINGPKDADKIHSIYTSVPDVTPMEPMKYANELLNSIRADEKYLLVLTDGDQFCEGTGAERQWYSIKDKYFVDKLGEYSEGVQFMYVGIDPPEKGMVPAEKYEDRQHHIAVESTGVLPALSELCNRIFGRDVLPVHSNQIDFDITMGKLIIFVQGESISDVRIDGGTRVNERKMKYVEKGAGACKDDGKVYNETDSSLQGMLVTYEGVERGTYDIQYKGTASSVAVYYEPDVTVKVWLTDLNDNEVDPENIYAGSYRLHYAMVDQDGTLTDSELLEDVTFSIPYPGCDPDDPHTDIRGKDESKHGYIEIKLAEGDILDGPYQAKYLKDFTTDPVTGTDMNWPDGGIVVKAIPKGTAALQITGGGNYPLSRLEQESEFRVTVLYDGQPVTGSDLDRVELSAEVKDGNVKWEAEQTQDGFVVRLKYNGTPADTLCGQQSIAFTAVYTNSFGKVCDPASASKDFTIEDDSQALIAELVLEEDYYVISRLETSAPIVLKLTIGGGALTPEQFEAAKVSVTIDGLQYDVQPDGTNSRYVITLKGGEDIKTGTYTVHCHVDGINGLGKPAQTDAAAEFELQNYPLWLRILFWVLVVLLIILLIWLYMNAKVLPKDIRIAPGGTFNVDGELIPGQISCSYNGKNKKRGTLRVQSPQCMSNPMARCGFTLELEAISPRRTRSSARSVLVRGINPMNTSTTQNLQIGTRTLTKDPNTGNMVGVGIKPGAPVDVRIGNNANAMIMAEVMDMTDGNSVSCTLTARLKFF